MQSFELFEGQVPPLVARLLDTELSDDRHSETTAIPALCNTQAASLFSPMLKCSLKRTFSFLLYAHVCITIIV